MIPRELDRRFEAVIVWSASPKIPAPTTKTLTSLREAGALVGVIAPISVDELAERMGKASAIAAPLLVADSDGTGAIAVEDFGAHHFGAHRRDVDLAALDRAGDMLAASLVARRLTARALPRSAGSPRMNIELIAGSPQRTRGSRLKQLLLAHGIPGVAHLADLAVEAAQRAGIEDPRVVVRGAGVEIALLDSGDVALGLLEELWRRGVAPQTVLIVVDGLAGVPHRPPPVIDPDVRAATVVLVNAGRGSARAGTLVLGGGQARLHRLLADQLSRRRRHVLPEESAEVLWSLVVEGIETENERVHEALLTLADGHVGMTGAPLASDPSRHPSVVAAGIYDGAGAQSHLLTGPVAFELGKIAHAGTSLRRVLDLRTGVLYERSGVGEHAVETVRFTSLARPTTAAMRVRSTHTLRALPLLAPPAEDTFYERGRVRNTRWIRVPATTGGIVAAAAQTRSTHRRSMDGAAVTDRILDRLAIYRTNGDTPPDPSPAVDAVDQAATIGFDRLFAEHRQAWAQRWEEADIVVEGDDELQRDVRFSLFHLMASVADSGEAAVGARGLTGTGYSGHVFWDADTFVLPFLAATHPGSARAMLEYRLKRLPAAMAAARAAGRGGARFPWESARSGDDVTPTSAQDRSGRIVPIRTGQLEEHIVAEVPWAATCYADWSGDEAFARGPLRRILVETARYWASRIRVESDGSAHIYGVVGPDEYHEPVDDNAFTNVMARWNLRRAAKTIETSGADKDEDVDESERGRWLALADALFDGYDANSGIYEQFAGFHRLEPLIIAELAPHRPIAADLLLGAERTSGAQVIKQADVLMLHHLVPDEVVAGSLEPNLRFYEPRTAHGSSLSPAIHASVFARAHDFKPALEALRIAARMDLDDLTGSSALGLHLATMGGVWQALAFGFMGLRPRESMLHIDPVLPPTWSALELRLRFHGAKVQVRKERAHLAIQSDRPITVVVGGSPFVVGPGTLALRRRGAKWEVTS